MNKNELIKAVEQWFYDRGLHEADPEKQYLKLIEEIGELASGIARSDEDVIKDSIGDIAVVIIGLCTQTGVNAQRAFDIDIKVQDAQGFNIVMLVTLMKEMQSLFYGSSHVMYCKLHNLKAVKYARTILLEDMVNVLSRLSSVSRHLNMDLIDCIGSAYNEIKDRKGKMVNGVFVKEWLNNPKPDTALVFHEGDMIVANVTRVERTKDHRFFSACASTLTPYPFSDYNF